MSSNREVVRYRNNLTGKYDGKKSKRLRTIKGVVCVVILIGIVFGLIIGTSTVDGQSMEPTLHNGQQLFFLRHVKEYKVGDIISMRMPSGDYYVKRIVATEGDIVEISDGKLIVNGSEAEDANANGSTYEQENTVVYPYTVGEDAYFVLGDNREHSIDSRSFGAIVKYQIRGRILGNYD